MDPFGRDIEDIFQNFFGRSGGGAGRQTNTENEAGVLENITTKKGTYIIFEFSGKEVQNVVVAKDTGEDIYVERPSGVALLISFKTGNDARFNLPKGFKKKTPEWTFANGILEVLFKR